MRWWWRGSSARRPFCAYHSQTIQPHIASLLRSPVYCECKPSAIQTRRQAQAPAAAYALMRGQGVQYPSLMRATVQHLSRCATAFGGYLADPCGFHFRFVLAARRGVARLQMCFGGYHTPFPTDKPVYQAPVERWDERGVPTSGERQIASTRRHAPCMPYCQRPSVHRSRRSRCSGHSTSIGRYGGALPERPSARHMERGTPAYQAPRSRMWETRGISSRHGIQRGVQHETRVPETRYVS